MTIPRQRKNAVVFGAGITGLTAAHELAVRGFVVEVWETEPDPLEPTAACLVGGMARTQYGSINDPTNPTRRPAKPVRTQSIKSIERIVFPKDQADPAVLDAAERTRLAALIEGVAPNGAITGYALDLHAHCATDDEASKVRARARAEAIAEALGAAVAPARLDLNIYVDPFFEDPKEVEPDRRKECVEVIVRQVQLPGEHGFRFFPAFYRHVFDTMKRTPILGTQVRSPAEIAKTQAFVEQEGRLPGTRRPIDRRYVETARTAFDNLVPTTSQALAFDDDRYDPDVIPRRRTASLDALRRGLNVFVGGMGFTLNDVSKLYLKLVKYLTASSERRAGEYENISWWDYIEGDSYSESGQKRLDAWPRALVAMSAKMADARTQGNVIAQLLLDQILQRDYTDGTLNGPTSQAWLEPWRLFLEQSQGVRFRRGRLTGFGVADGDTLVVPTLEGYEGDLPPTFDDQFYVVALPLFEARAVARSLSPKVRSDQSGYATIQKLAKLSGDTAELKKPEPAGQLQHLIGIQFFFEEDVQWLNGHIYFPDSKWELTAISQAKFWRQKSGFRDRYYGSLSICIGNWHAPGSEGKCAWELAPGEIASEVWAQIIRALDGRSSASGEFIAPPGGLPLPIAYHLDWNLVDDATGRTNTSPLLVNLPGSWSERPGDLEHGYELVLDHIAFAGTHMQTHTRLTTMEAANESARHAVNAILRAVPSGAAGAMRRGNLCGIWNPEDSELEDLTFLKDIDRELFNRGLPHLLDILGVDGSGVLTLDSAIELVRRGGVDVLRGLRPV